MSRRGNDDNSEEKDITKVIRAMTPQCRMAFADKVGKVDSFVVKLRRTRKPNSNATFNMDQDLDFKINHTYQIMFLFKIRNLHSIDNKLYEEIREDLYFVTDYYTAPGQNGYNELYLVVPYASATTDTRQRNIHPERHGWNNYNTFSEIKEEYKEDWRREPEDYRSPLVKKKEEEEYPIKTRKILTLSILFFMALFVTCAIVHSFGQKFGFQYSNAPEKYFKNIYKDASNEQYDPTSPPPPPPPPSPI